MKKLSVTDSLYTICFFVVLVSLLSSLVGKEIRYVKYALPFLSIMFFLCFKGTIKKDVKYISPYLLLMGVSAIGFWRLGVFGYKDIFFIIAYVTPFLLFTPKSCQDKKLFCAVVVTFFIFAASVSVSQLKSFSFMGSTAPFESVFCFVFGAFAVYFFITRRFVYFAVSLVLVFLTLKRIVVLAVFASVFLTILPVKIKTFLVSNTSFIIVNAFVCVFLLLFAGGFFENIISEVFSKNSNAFSLGRFDIFNNAIDKFSYNFEANIIFGMGVGHTYIERFPGMGVENLHSDILKIFFEFGFFVFLFFIFCSVYKLNLEERIFFVYLNVVFLTDNVLIYVQVMFFIIYLFYFVGRRELRSCNYVS